MDSRFDEQVKR